MITNPIGETIMKKVKVDSELHTVASAELQKEIDAILQKDKKNEDPVQHDGDGNDQSNTKSE